MNRLMVESCKKFISKTPIGLNSSSTSFFSVPNQFDNIYILHIVFGMAAASVTVLSTIIFFCFVCHTMPDQWKDGQVIV